MPAGHSGPGGPWSSFEDQVIVFAILSVLFFIGRQYSNFLLYQALVVLVHDMGENWELVSDALNSIIQLKVTFYLG
jgi:hypothetical protein